MYSVYILKHPTFSKLQVNNLTFLLLDTCIRIQMSIDGCYVIPECSGNANILLDHYIIPFQCDSSLIMVT